MVRLPAGHFLGEDRPGNALRNRPSAIDGCRAHELPASPARSHHGDATAAWFPPAPLTTICAVCVPADGVVPCDDEVIHVQSALTALAGSEL